MDHGHRAGRPGRGGGGLGGSRGGSGEEEGGGNRQAHRVSSFVMLNLFQHPVLRLPAE
jgi:hypothetical protein